MEINKMNTQFPSIPTFPSAGMYRIPIIPYQIQREHIGKPQYRAQCPSQFSCCPPVNDNRHQEEKQFELEFSSLDSNIDMLPPNLFKMHEEEMSKLNVPFLLTRIEAKTFRRRRIERLRNIPKIR